MSNYYPLSEELKRLRRARRLSQSEAAAEIGVNASYLNKVEAKHEPVSLRVLALLARLYVTSLEDLLRLRRLQALAEYDQRLEAQHRKFLRSEGVNS